MHGSTYAFVEQYCIRIEYSEFLIVRYFLFFIFIGVGCEVFYLCIEAY